MVDSRMDDFTERAGQTFGGVGRKQINPSGHGHRLFSFHDGTVPLLQEAAFAIGQSSAKTWKGTKPTNAESESNKRLFQPI
mmetsp:Transcript_15037/g.61306  ORF Transcript_15037/g.61306 Transcript_15037/m.61306 type:complete len:81 (-) Transcript_15037:43-285(-)